MTQIATTSFEYENKEEIIFRMLAIASDASKNENKRANKNNGMVHRVNRTSAMHKFANNDEQEPVDRRTREAEKAKVVKETAAITKNFKCDSN